ncbi:MAG: aldehyde dehydrogenase family protein [Paracoccaceae bacterium]
MTGTDTPIAQLFSRMKAGNDARRRDFGLAERRAALDKLADMVRRNEAAIIAALKADLGRPEAEAILMDYLNILQEIRHARHHLRAWMKPRKVWPTLSTFGSSARVIPQPRGTCLIIAPWNLPFHLALGPLASCLAAGNAAIVKPSELTPASSALIARMIGETFPPDLVAVVEGDKAVAEDLLSLPFDHIFFTGSPAVGRIVMAAAAKTLASVTLELGGKSPVIVGPDANLKQAADWITFGKFLNAGQNCISPDHLCVHASVKADFLALLKARIARAYGSGEASPHLTQIVSPAHAARLSALIADAIDKGATPLIANGQDGRSIGPHLLEGVGPEMRAMQEEIFGPILPIFAYEDIDTVIAEINARDKPLVLYIFDRKAGLVDDIVTRTSSGAVGVNLTLLHYSHLNLPFGGVNTSGIGVAHGKAGFQAFSHERAVMRNRFLLLPILFPPYGPRTLRLVHLLKRILG